MKKKPNHLSSVKQFVFYCCLVLLIMPLSINSQSENLFNDPEATKDFFNGKVYEVPNFGTLTFKYNKAATKAAAERHEKSNAADEVVDLVFDIAIKRNNKKKKDKGDYRVEIRINLDEKEDINTNPNKDLCFEFSILRESIYPIKGFPDNYVMFSDGDLYFRKFDYKKYSLKEYKAKKLNSNNMDPDSDVKVTLIQCKPLTGK